ncbi:tyrosine recombinase XerC [Clostridium fallax]|uniref:Site-specific recombinase XerD n=1 Tax=Clostridium fallax TaxID=1533 RepID=A0A1M4Z9N3_9CLOT|nr:tyrosine recombinase XerC [Clostridium fallax]SHF14740.1 Site-specific recombinase XerD [Clostridium fallax]SQB06437.1 site-specific recombinase XerD [Clostridium fallax]
MKFNMDVFEDSTLPLCLIDFFNYLETIKGKSNNTIKAYKFDLVMFFRFLKLYKRQCDNNLDFNEISINDIDDDFLKKIRLSDLYAFLSFTEKYRENGTYARARKVASLKSFFKFLSGKASIIEDNPALELESPKISKRHPIYLTLDESIKLLNSMDKNSKFYKRDYCILTLFLNCGLRVSELCNINMSKIKGDTLTIIGKGNKERTVYLNNACLKSIKEYLKDRNKIERVNIEDLDALFISSKKRRINKRSIELLVKKYTKSAGLTEAKYTPHKLRHTAATLMYKYGNVDIRSLQQILGHENISTTQIYTHVDDESLREAVKSNPLGNIK